MKRLLSLLILFIVFSLLGKTAVTSFCPEKLNVMVTSSDWAEETAEEDESGEDDKALANAVLVYIAPASQVLMTASPTSRLLSGSREIVAPPPQA